MNPQELSVKTTESKYYGYMDMAMTHSPSNITVTGTGKHKATLYFQLMKEIEFKLEVKN